MFRKWIVQVKTFAMQSDLNKWLSETSKIKVINIKESGGNLLVIYKVKVKK